MGLVMPKIVSRDIPLSELTLRKYEKPYNLGRRELVKKLCLSTGLLQPGDSRDIVVDILFVLLEHGKKKKEMSSEEIASMVIRTRKKHRLLLAGIAGSNIRRQIKRLRDLFLVEKVKNKYRITEFSNMSETFSEKLEQFLLPSILLRVKEYFGAVDEEFFIKKKK